MLDGRFQVANRSDLSDTVNIHHISKIPFYEQNVAVEQASSCRYAVYRFEGTQLGAVAEIEFWGINDFGEEEKLQGTPIGNPGVSNNELEMAFDGDRISFFSPRQGGETYVGLDFGTPRRITRIKYSPRSDDNGIVPGELYELFYWDKRSWVSLGRQTGRNDYTLVYMNVPANTLLDLHNHTRGKENHPFTCENGKQVWW
jgi:hypothetical protein